MLSCEFPLSWSALQLAAGDPRGCLLDTSSGAWSPLLGSTGLEISSSVGQLVGGISQSPLSCLPCPSRGQLLCDPSRGQQVAEDTHHGPHSAPRSAFPRRKGLFLTQLGFMAVPNDMERNMQ